MARTSRSAAAPAQTTRERVLELALELVRQRGDAELSLVDLAAAAGLSRQMLYVLFRSRAGLLMAMVDHLDARSGAGERLASLRTSMPPAQAFEPYLRAWFDYLPEVLPVARALSAAAARGDADAAAAWGSRLAKLRAGFTLITRAFHAAGVLKAGWTPETAADWILALTHVDLWQHLVVEAGWKPAVHIDRIVATLRETLLDASRG
ncbi:MAG: TetR/AcrR family transcriptional regulator [Pseudomonadota bacterium]